MTTSFLPVASAMPAHSGKAPVLGFWWAEYVHSNGTLHALGLHIAELPMVRFAPVEIDTELR